MRRRRKQKTVRQLMIAEMATLTPDRFRELEAVCEEEDGFIRPVDAAQVMGVSRQYLTQLMRDGKLDTWELGGQKFLSMRQVEEAVTSSRRKAG